jgi:hypothetical protein
MEWRTPHCARSPAWTAAPPGSLLRSFERHLWAQNRSERTVGDYPPGRPRGLPGGHPAPPLQRQHGPPLETRSCASSKNWLGSPPLHKVSGQEPVQVQQRQHLNHLRALPPHHGDKVTDRNRTRWAVSASTRLSLIHGATTSTAPATVVTTLGLVRHHCGRITSGTGPARQSPDRRAGHPPAARGPGYHRPRW